MQSRFSSVEVAFFGGSFTAIDRDYMVSLLDATVEFRDRISGIRLSTRPDCIDDEVLLLLKGYGVTSIELGAQSMDNEVLAANNRGHNADDIVKAAKLIKNYGFSLGLQMMTGLYKSSFQKDIKTAEQFIALKPNTVRIYPTVIMQDTELAELYLNNLFEPYSLNQSVELCARLILMFEQEGINIIRLGLHYSDSLVQNSLGNNYHPAFKELCESKIFYDKFLEKANNYSSKELTVYINPKSVSKFLGQKKSNLKKLADLGYKISIVYDTSLGKYDLNIK